MNMRKIFLNMCVIAALLLIPILGTSLPVPVVKGAALQSESLRDSSQLGAPAGAGRMYSAADGTKLLVSDPVKPTLSAPFRDLPVEIPPAGPARDINPRLNQTGNHPDFRAEGKLDPLLEVQKKAPPATVTDFVTPILNFEGQGYTYVNPPDTVGDVGPNHFIQLINAGGGAQMMIYNKSGVPVAGPTLLSALGSGVCATGIGDPIVLYDSIADRWMLAEFAGSGNNLCVYISQTPDPLGAYYNYAFATPNFPDYPKYAVWPDAYYLSTNEGDPAAYALDRTRMLAGLPATSQRFTAPPLTGFGFQALTPSDFDGANPPPAGSPNYFMRHRDTEVHGPPGMPTQDILEIWQYHVDFANPGNSTFTGPINILVAEFDSDLCGLTSFSCIPQPGSGVQLDPLREVIMWRLQYRNFGDYETLVGNFVTDVNGNDHAGVRWFELRKIAAAPWTLYQEGTYAPDASNRWMGSISMDGSGNIALGYNVSDSVSVYPSLRYVGRLASDPLGTLPQGEAVLIAGSAANGSNRYGDYSAMTVDPVDNCTFWFTGEYNVDSTWSTRIGTFRFDTCTGNIGPNFILEATPAALTVCASEPAVYHIGLGQTNGFDQMVTLSTLGEPPATAVSFAPNPVLPADPPATSTLTISNTAGSIPGLYTIDIIGTAITRVHTATVGLELFTNLPGQPVLLTPANEATNVGLQPTFSWQSTQGKVYEIEVATDRAFTHIIAAASGLTNTTFTPSVDLARDTVYYWHVRANNTCGDSLFSTVYRFITRPALGACSQGSQPVTLLGEGFEAGANGWTTGGSGISTWAASSVRKHSGIYSYKANDVGTVTDQWLNSPQILLPAGQSQFILSYYNFRRLQTGGCFDGGILEASTDGGVSWTQLNNQLLTDPYDGVIAASNGNPLAGSEAWCGAHTWSAPTFVSLNDFAGQSMAFRFRLGTDSSGGYEGWYVDDVTVQSCVPNTTLIPGESNLQVVPGSVVTHTFMLTNTGATDTFNLSVTGYNWPTELVSESPITVTTGATATVQVRVTAPTMPGPLVDIFTLTASSANIPGISISSHGETRLTVLPGISLTPISQTLVTAPGSEAVYAFMVTNTGTYTDIFSLQAISSLSVTLSATTAGPLGPGESTQITLTVIVPQTLLPGSMETTTLMVTTGWEPKVKVGADAITWVGWPVYLPFVSKR